LRFFSFKFFLVSCDLIYPRDSLLG
ncbi:putative conserved membrane protein, partial [Chlamydia psittaci 08DC60]